MFGLLAMTVISLYSMAEDEPPRYWDFNNDGKEDVWYENSEYSYVQYQDRDFDGVADQRVHYDSRTDWPLYGDEDENFDGIFESRLVFENGRNIAILVDSDQDQCFDIVHYYRHDMTYESKMFVTTLGWNRVTTIKYKYEFPVETQTDDTLQTACDFHKEIISGLPNSNDMPEKRSN